MGCIEQKLGSGVTELKKWYFHLFCQIYHEKQDKNKANLREILVQVWNIGPVSSLVSVLPTQGVFST